MVYPRERSMSYPTGSRYNVVRVYDPPKQCLKVFDKHGIWYEELSDEEKKKEGIPLKHRVYLVKIPREKLDVVGREYFECVVGGKSFF